MNAPVAVITDDFAMEAEDVSGEAIPLPDC
jgi:hypothetical protein